MQIKSTILIIMFMVALTGCANPEPFIEEQLIRQAGLYDMPEYQSYKEYSDKDAVDIDGYAIDDEFEQERTIHVTLAENNNLRVNYYLDEEHQIPVQTECSMDPGDILYSTVQVWKDSLTNAYSFSEFRLFEITDKGERHFLTEISADDDASDYAIRIPEDFTGTELSVEPVGEYKNRVLTLSDSYEDESGNTYEPYGTWSINREKVSGKSVEVGPLESFIVTYNYDPTQFFFVSSEPNCYYNNNEDGVVIFDEQHPTNQNDSFEVRLSNYITIDLEINTDREVSVNNEEKQDKHAGDIVSIQKLKYGDQVTIITNKEWKELEYSKELVLLYHSHSNEEGYFYTLYVPERGGQFLFNPDDYTYEHGTISFECFGQPVTSPIKLARGRKIYYKAGEIEEGYWLPDSGIKYIEVGDEESTKAKIASIHFEKQTPVEVVLPQPDYGGRIVYTLNNERLKGDRCSTFSGVTISIEYIPWRGWGINSKLTKSLPESYIVNEDKLQILPIYSDIKGQSLFLCD